MIERRKSVRIECEITATYTDLDSSNPTRSENGILRNISRSGIKMRVNDFIPIQDRLRLSIQLPANRSIEVYVMPSWEVELPHLGKYEIGARFVDMRPEDEDAIQNFQYHSLLEKMPFRPNVVKDLLKDNSQLGPEKA